MADNKNIYYIIAAVVVVAIIVGVLMMGKGKVQETPVVTEPQAEPAAAPAETTPTVTTPAPTETPDVVKTDSGEVAEIKYASRGILSDVKCENGKMSAIITNVQDINANIEPNTYETDVRIVVDGIVSKWFVCDKKALAPGEYTYCSDLLGPMSSRLTNDAKNEVAVWFISDMANRGTVTDISCAGSTQEDQVDAPYNP